MKGSFRIGTVSRINIYAHWTMLVMLVGLFVFYMYRGASAVAAIAGVGLVVTVFGCVILHELGHALMARRFGIPTLDITMYPIGGVARLQRIPKEPKEELLIALAGPAVNVAIATVLYLVNSALGWTSTLDVAINESMNVLTLLMWINAGLVLFNLIPAFPMDGGRVLRAGLAMSIDYRRATHIASTVGIGFAFLFGIYGIFTLNPTLPFVAIFVYYAARQEVQAVMEKT